jgi:pimeloyl-ACP methyl ester carboxylesterase
MTRTIIDEGKGTPPLVLIHGLCCHSEDWRWHIDAFSASHRVLAPTLRGHDGDTLDPDDLTITGQAEDIAQLFEARDISGAILCGHSMGVRVALETAAQVPDRVAGLVLIDGSHSVPGDLDPALAGLDGIAEIKTWAQGFFDEMFLPNTHLAEQATFSARIAAMPEGQLRAIYRNLMIWDGTHFADRLRVAAEKPMLVLQSTIRDDGRSRRWLKPGERGPFLDMLGAGHPDCTIVTYPDRGHFINLDEPEKMQRDIEVWMDANGLTGR